jgi:hypothetical protein
MLQTWEEEMLEMPFERILTQINLYPIKFFCGDSDSAEAKARFDKQMSMKQLTSFLLERLKREFEDSIKLLN